MKRHYVVTALALALGLGMGFLLGRGAGPASRSRPATDGSGSPSEQVYTCSMHPQVRLTGPGKCPICEMPLIPASAALTRAGDAPTLQLSDHALAMANVETAAVARRELSRDLRAVGKVQYNEASLATVTARVDGYAERLFVNFTGVQIEAGDHLAEVYSPDLILAQQELLIALQSHSGDGASPLVESSKLKLRRWGMTDEQIVELVAGKSITDRITFHSPIAGTVIEKSLVENSAFRAGDALYRIANLDTVWVYLDVYELDLAWVRYGQSVELTAEGLPGRVFTGLVTFVQPLVDDETRTVRVPVHIDNADHALRPGMYVSAVIRSVLGEDGSAAPTGVEGKFTCPMHPQVLRGEAGPCPVCEMELERIPGVAAPSEPAADVPPAPQYACPMECEGPKTYPQPGNCPVCEMALEPRPVAHPASAAGLLAVPVSAVLDSGTRRIVYVERSRGVFEPREVGLGPRAGEHFPVLSGLSDGERVVTRGGFLIDSQFQITGHPSLFYPGGLMAGSAGHQHGGGSQPAPSAAPAPPGAGSPHKH